MKKFMESCHWFVVLISHLLALSALVFCISLPLGSTGFLSGYIGWPIVITLLLNEMDDEVKDALKKWAEKKAPSDVGAPNGEEADN